MGDLAQLQGLLGPEGGQEPQLGQDKATDSAEWDENKHPRKDNGQFGTGSVPKIDIDFSKDNELPKINKKDADELGVKQLPVRLKKTIIDRQNEKHPESREEANKIIASAVYSPDAKIPGKKPGYMHFIKSLDNDENSLVLLDLEESPDGYYDIVHYFKVDDRNKKRIEKNAKK